MFHTLCGPNSGIYAFEASAKCAIGSERVAKAQAMPDSSRCPKPKRGCGRVCRRAASSGPRACSLATLQAKAVSSLAWKWHILLRHWASSPGSCHEALAKAQALLASYTALNSGSRTGAVALSFSHSAASRKRSVDMAHTMLDTPRLQATKVAVCRA